MNPVVVKHLVRLGIVAAAAVGVQATQPVPQAQAACKACVTPSCVNVDGGTNACSEFSDGTCAAGGDVCNPA
jgi:hypothetical protein